MEKEPKEVYLPLKTELCAGENCSKPGKEINDHLHLRPGQNKNYPEGGKIHASWCCIKCYAQVHANVKPGCKIIRDCQGFYDESKHGDLLPAN